MSDSEHSTVSHTSISSDSDPSAWGIPLTDAGKVSELDPYKEVDQLGHVAPPSPSYVPDPIELEHHVSVYVPEPVEDPEGDPIDYAADADDDEDEDEVEESFEDDDEEEEDHLAHAVSIVVASLAVDPIPSTEETKPFETDESAAIPQSCLIHSNSTVPHTFYFVGLRPVTWAFHYRCRQGFPSLTLIREPVEDPEEEPKEDLEEDPIDYVADADDDEDEEEESSEDDDDEEEENLAYADSTVVASLAVDPVPSAEETEPFETDESAAIPPPPPAYRTTSRMSVRSQAHIPFPYEAEVARLLALPTLPPSLLTPLSSPLPQIPSPPLPSNQDLVEGCITTTITYITTTHHPLPLPAPSTSRRADNPEADIPPRKRLLLTSPTPRFEVGESSVAAARQPGSTVTRRVDYSFVDTVDASIRALKRKTMAAIEMVNLRRDRAALRDEVDTLRRYLSSLCTTHEQEIVEARQALDRSESYNRALEARIAVLETQAYRHEWQRQDVDDHATRAIMWMQALEAGARVDTLEDTGISA
ncbi:hypothetical protein Tco_0874628 [Tanacetum coccineum]|uniref:Uncharacterized protein n=1 Tax=Tanacetum coccineum TaxID=301880 RepID=A0ABQ5BQ03_9ASTR